MILFNMSGHAMITRKHTTHMNYSALIKGVETPLVIWVYREVSVMHHIIQTYYIILLMHRIQVLENTIHF